MAKRQRTKPMGWKGGLVGMTLIGLLGLWMLHNRSRHEAEFNRCYSNGIAYYKAVGSYPHFSTGELASDEVVLRCKNMPIAFDGIENVS